MSTRVSFYIKRQEWVGSASFAWYPDELPEMIATARTEAVFRAAVLAQCPRHRDRLDDPYRRFEQADFLYSFEDGDIVVGEDIGGQERWTRLADWDWNT